MLDRGDAGERGELLVGQPLDRVEPDGSLVEPAADELVDRARLEDLAVVHDREPVAQDLRLLHVVRRQQDRPALDP